MKTAIYVCLGIILAASITVAAILLRGPLEKETLSTLAGLLAVVAAAIAVLPALRVLALQEDSLLPRPTPYFDVTSRYDLLQLRVKNFGTSAAFDVQLHWKTPPVDHQGNTVRALDSISVLLPQESVSTLLGASHALVSKLSDARFEGECRFKDASGKTHRQKFVCSVDATQKQLVHDSELPRTLYDLQSIPKELARIADRLEEIVPRPKARSSSS